MASAQLQGFIHNLRTAAAARGLPGVSDVQLLERFTAGRDEAAFELLVWRHGKMVFNVCRRLLRDAHEAEDAFQACFLTLARRAASISRRESLAGWLHKVAYRTALAALSGPARRRPSGSAALEQVPGGADPAAEVAWREVRRVIDDEVSRLPGKYRLAFILCHLQGQTNAEAARELGCPVGTVESRLTWARQRLRSRLARRGVTLSAGLFLALLLQKASAAAPPALLAAAAGKAAVLAAAGQAVTTVVSGRAVALADGVLRGMALVKVKAVACVVLAAGLVVAGAGGLTYGPPAPGAPAVAAAAEPDRPRPRETEAARVGRLMRQLGGDGFDEREAAGRELEKVGAPALPSLRRASRGADPETRRRAEALVETIDRAALAREILRPTRVHLAYKDTPLAQAVADFADQSGYAIALNDPDGALQGRIVTLDTGETTFWEAWDRFCRTAGLREAGAELGQLALEGGTPEVLPTCYAGAVRVRARAGARAAVPAPAREGGISVRLQFSLEPKAAWHGQSYLRPGTALGDRGQALNEAPAPPAPRGVGFVITFGSPDFPTHLSKLLRLSGGGAEGKAIKELPGKLSAEVVAAPRPVVTADNLLTAAGRGFSGADGGSLEVREVVRQADGRVKVRLKLAPPSGLVPAGAKRAGAPLALDGVLNGSGLAIVLQQDNEATGPDFGTGLLLFDGRGNAVARQVTSAPPGGAAGAAPEYVVTFTPPKDRGGVKLVFSGSRTGTVDVPFALKDIVLP